MSEPLWYLYSLQDDSWRRKPFEMRVMALLETDYSVL